MKTFDRAHNVRELLRNLGETDTTRRDFLVRAALALTGVTVSLVGCGRETVPGGDTTTAAGKSGNISANHGHTAFVSSAQLSAGNALVLDITGSSGHSHSVTLSQAQIQSIAAGGRVSVISSGEAGHAHTVTFN